MTRRRWILALPLAALAPALLPAPAAAQGLKLAGVEIAPAAQVAGARLVLNGAGIRYKFVKVYTAALYLGAKASTPEAVLAQAGPKRLAVTMLRDIDGNELGKLFTRGMQDNNDKAEFSKMIAGTLRMSEIFSTRKKLVAGESFTVDWVPGTGTVIAVNGQAAGAPIAEPEFYSGLMRIWLGPNPAEATLKAALLGKPQAGSGEGS